MQKQKINYLALQSNYEQIEVGLFTDQQLLSKTELSKFTAASQLIPTIQELLATHALNLKTLNFICANLGPAPFTTLRTTIVTVNGLGFANQVPLVGVNGLLAFAQNAKPNTKNLVIILNAYGQSVYYAYRTNGEITYGWQTLSDFLVDIQTKFQTQQTVIIGLGISNFSSELASLPANFKLDPTYPGYPALELIAQGGFAQYQNKLTSQELQPLYLKQAEPLK